MIAHSHGKRQRTKRLTVRQQQIAVRLLPHAQKCLKGLLGRFPLARKLDLEGMEHDCLCRCVMRASGLPEEMLILYLKRSIRNAVVNALSVKALVVTNLSGGDVVDPKEQPEIVESPKIVRRMLRQFTPRGRRILLEWSRFPADRSLGSIAKEIGVSRQALHWLVRKLEQR